MHDRIPDNVYTAPGSNLALAATIAVIVIVAVVLLIKAD